MPARISPRRWTAWIVDLWDEIRQSYWFLPLLMTLVSAGAAALMLEVDARIDPALRDLGADAPRLLSTSADGARAVLGVVAGSMITVTGVVFSITVVALVLASSQFGPRLLRSFMRDRGNQFVLGAFLSTFLYSLLVLQGVEDGGFVPQVATAVAVGLGVGSLFVLIYFIHHVSSSIQASAVIASVSEELDGAIEVLFPEPLGAGGDPEAPPPRPAEGGVEVAAPRAGYVRIVDEEALFAAARAASGRVILLRRPGDFVATGAPVARVHHGPDGLEDSVAEAVARAFVVGAQRTPVQDVCFLTDQLVEMAVRALSPGVNDPGTAVACVHRLGDLLARLVDRAEPDGLRRDADGTLRVEAEPRRFEEIAARCLDPIRRYGGTEVQVVVAVFEALGEALRRCGEPGRRRILVAHVEAFRAAFRARSDAGQRDAALVARALARVGGEGAGARGPGAAADAG